MLNDDTLARTQDNWISKNELSHKWLMLCWSWNASSSIHKCIALHNTCWGTLASKRTPSLVKSVSRAPPLKNVSSNYYTWSAMYYIQSNEALCIYLRFEYFYVSRGNDWTPHHLLPDPRLRALDVGNAGPVFGFVGIILHFLRGTLVCTRSNPREIRYRTLRNFVSLSLASKNDPSNYNTWSSMYVIKSNEILRICHTFSW